MFHNTEKYEKAITCFKKVLKIQPDNKSVHHNLGAAFKELKKYQKATKAFSKALKIERKKTTLKLYGETLLNINEHKKGLEYLQECSGVIKFSMSNFKILS